MSAIIKQMGTIQFVLTARPSPPPCPLIIFACPCEDGSAEFRVLSDGSFDFHVKAADGSVLVGVQTQPVTFAAAGLVIAAISWDGQSAAVYINGQQLKPAADGAEAVAFETSVPGPGGSTLSIQDPVAAEACRPWVERRAKKFVAASARKGRRPKTLDEQAGELLVAVQGLRRARELVQGGEHYLVGFLAGTLRALIHWNRPDAPDQSYNPLLLRLANVRGLPLPVYAMPPPDVAEINKQVPGLSMSYGSPSASLAQKSPVHNLIDLQDWLETAPLQVLSSDGKTYEALTLKQMVFDTATALGNSHYDPDSPVLLDHLRNLRMFEVDALLKALCWVSAVVEDLGIWVLSELGSSGQVKPLVQPLAQAGTLPQPQPPQTG